VQGDCHRARQWASVELDGELSSFERVLLDAHLSACASCAEFHAAIGETTTSLRAAPLEPFHASIELKRAWSSVRLRAAPLAAAMAVVAVGLGSILAATAVRGRSVEDAGAHARVPAAKTPENMDLRTARVLAARPERQLLLAGRRPVGGGIVVAEP